ncbi:MAG: hypothetical protein DMF73_02150 [Acidobacteria bacterium]|nr:MAG: hypothetical protein DMF73_02150 [Acidobacteriota bacterium]
MVRARVPGARRKLHSSQGGSAARSHSLRAAIPTITATRESCFLINEVILLRPSKSGTGVPPVRPRARCACHLNLLAIVVALIAASASAQEFRGSITGRVLDPSTAAVPSARITFLNAGTNASAAVFSDSDGNYAIPYVAAGVYDITVEAAGFKKLSRRGVEVRVGDKLTIDFTLEVGEIREVVTIINALPLLESASASAGQVIDRRRISELPLSESEILTTVRQPRHLVGGCGGRSERKRIYPRRNSEHRGQRTARCFRSAGGRGAGVQSRDGQL